MVFRKRTIDNSLRYVPKSEQTRENKKQSEQIQHILGGKPNTRKQNKIFSKNNKKFVIDFTARGFSVLI